METRMMRVRTEIHTTLQQLADDEGISMQAVLDQALEEYRRNRLFRQADEAYRRLQADPEAWQQELAERAAWDGTLMDHIDSEASDQATSEQRFP